MSGEPISAYIVAIFGSWAGATVNVFSYMIPRKILPERLYMQGSGVILGAAVLFGGCISTLVMGNLVEAGWKIEYVLGSCGMMFLICMLLSCFVHMGESATDA